MPKKQTRRKILQKLRKSSAMKEAQSIDYDEKTGDAVISIGLKTTEEFFHPYSYKSYDLMNPDIIEYIDMCEGEIPLQDNICLDFYTEENTSNIEKKRMREAIKRHNAEQVVVTEKNLKKLNNLHCLTQKTRRHD